MLSALAWPWEMICRGGGCAEQGPTRTGAGAELGAQGWGLRAGHVCIHRDGQHACLAHVQLSMCTRRGGYATWMMSIASSL